MAATWRQHGGNGEIDLHNRNTRYHPPPLPLSSSHEDHQRIVQVVTVCARDAVVSRDRHSAPRGPIIG